MFAQPQQEHHWLDQLVGDWTSEMKCSMGPDQPEMVNKGTESVRSLGGLWTLGEGTAEMPDGATGTMLMTLGYDPQKKKYVGTFIGSMMTHMWHYEGTVDASGKILTLDTEGPDMSGGPEGPDAAAGVKMVKYQDIIEFVDADTRLLRSQTQGPDGAWTQFMSATYRRKK